MKVGKKLGLTAAVLVSGLAGTGIGALIALDLLGEELLVKLWRGARAETSTPADATASLLEKARDVTFFTTAPAQEHGVEVTTGVSFATVADLLAAKQKSRWCYIVASPRSGLARQVELGRQSGSGSPVYADLSVYPADELAVIGLSARTLQSLAKSHCRFAKGTTTAPSSKGEGRT